MTNVIKICSYYLYARAPRILLFYASFKKCPKIISYKEFTRFCFQDIYFPGQTIQNGFSETFLVNTGYNFHTDVC